MPFKYVLGWSHAVFRHCVHCIVVILVLFFMTQETFVYAILKHDTNSLTKIERNWYEIHLCMYERKCFYYHYYYIIHLK